MSNINSNAPKDDADKMRLLEDMMQALAHYKIENDELKTKNANLESENHRLRFEISRLWHDFQQIERLARLYFICCNCTTSLKTTVVNEVRNFMSQFRFPQV